jgi:hypothetical protein
MLESLKNILSNLRQSPYNIFFNPLTNTGLAIAAILALIADQFGQGYYLVLIVTLVLIIIGIWLESQKYDLYKHQAIPLPIVIKIGSSELAMLQILQVFTKSDFARFGIKSNLLKTRNLVKYELQPIKTNSFT